MSKPIEKYVSKILATLGEDVNREGLSETPKRVANFYTQFHMCMEMRGVKVHDSEMQTNCFRGVFLNDLNCRNEFMAAIK